MTIRNIVFDIGNVLVRWDPKLIVERTFGPERATQALVTSIFPGDDVWIPLNRGEISASEAMERYRNRLGFSRGETDRLWENVLGSMDLFPETVALMAELRSGGQRLFALSDNVHEIVAHLKAEHDYWKHFENAVISAEVGMLKPEAGIYKYLLENNGLEAQETAFFDDMPRNVEGARAMGIHAFLFTDAANARSDLQGLGVQL